MSLNVFFLFLHIFNIQQELLCSNLWLVRITITMRQLGFQVKTIHISDIPKQNSLEKLLVSFCVAWPVLLNFLIQKVLQCEGVVSPIQVCHLGNKRHGWVYLPL